MERENGDVLEKIVYDQAARLCQGWMIKVLEGTWNQMFFKDLDFQIQIFNKAWLPTIPVIKLLWKNAGISNKSNEKSLFYFEQINQLQDRESLGLWGRDRSPLQDSYCTKQCRRHSTYLSYFFLRSVFSNEDKKILRSQMTRSR